MRTFIADIVSKKGEEVELMGWVNIRRDHGKIIFIDLRDRTAMAQLVIVPSAVAAYEAASRSRAEWVLRVKGKVSERPAKLINPNIATGSVEVQVSEIEVLNEAEALPFPIDSDGSEIGEEVRLQYRYLDLRR